MPLNWFRRRKQTQDAAAPEAVESTAALTTTTDEEPAPPAETGAEQAKKRRRGTRGGRNRKRPAKTEAAEDTEAKPAAARKTREKPARDKPARGGERSERSSRSRSRRRTPTRRAPLPAAKRELLVSVGVTERRVAVLEDDKVAEVYLERPERRSIAGNIYLGTVDNVLPGMEAAFVDIGLEKNGFLFVDEIVSSELEGRRHGKRIQDLLSRGQHILVQAVKDPMKSKGARLTTEISLPGRFVVYVPSGEGFGVSRRLDDDERARLREILKSLDVKKGGLIVRTAAEGASAEDIERDFDFLQRLWKTIEQRATKLQAPALVYLEAELPLRVTRDLFTEDFERAYVDDDRTYKRIVGYLKKTSPHMAERVVRHRSKAPLMEEFGVDAEINSTLSRRVDLPSGGYLIFDYAEAFTVIDVNTGRFVGSRSKTSTQTLEDTITKNNIEAVKEVVRQLRLRDIGGIIVIDFIDMANPKNRATVEEALRQELERDRTKTYVVEISPLGLVEMTRQNVTDGPREILAKKCPTCAGDGIVVSEATAAVELERRLKTLVRGSRSKVFRVEVNARVANLLIGPAAARLTALEETAKRRFVFDTRDDVPVDHLEVVAQGPKAELEPGPVKEGSEVSVKLVEVGLHDGQAGVGKLDGIEVQVAGGAGLIGKKVRARVERVMDGTAYALLVSPAPKREDPITAEAEAEKPTRRSKAKSVTEASEEAVVDEPLAEEEEEEESPLEAVAEEESLLEVVAEEVPEEQPAEEVVAVEAEVAADADADERAAEQPKRKTRRGSRGGRGRKRKPAQPVAADASANGGPPVDEPGPPGAARIHLPPETLGEAEEQADEGEPVAVSDDGGEQPKPKRKTRRGTRGGRNRRRKPAATAVAEAPSEQGSAE